MRISDWSSDVCSSDLVLNLGLAEDDVRVRGWGLVHIWLGDDKQNVLRLIDGHADDVWHLAHAQLLHGIAALLLAAAQIGRASCRERVCQDVLISMGAVSLKKTQTCSITKNQNK